MLNGKIVVITGGSDGIGKALVELYLKKGARVATCGRSKEKLGRLKASYNPEQLLAIEADVSRKEDCERFVQSVISQWGGIDILINNAGISMRALFRDTEFETLRRVMEVNFWGTVYCTKYALDSLLDRKGSIVAVSSIAGFRGLPGRSGYSASKYAMNGWMESLRTELLDSGVNVLWVCPGFTTSNIRNAALNKDAQPQGESPMDESKMMSARECADRIADAIEKRRRTLVLTFTGKRTVWMNKLIPGLTDKLVRKFFFKDGILVQ